MKYKIVSDSSSNILSFSKVPYATVPLKIITSEKEYVDNAELDVSRMVAELKVVKGRTQTSCPNVHEWRTAMEDADAVFAITITSGLSGSCSTAEQAKKDLLAADPDKKIAVIDSLSTGPEMLLLIEKIAEGIQAEKPFEQIEAEVRSYQKHTHLLFALESMTNLARNGRVNPVVAKIAGVLGIRVVGIASQQGTLELLYKPRGQEKMLGTLYDEMKARCYAGGKVRISHCYNEPAAKSLADRIKKDFPNADIEIGLTTALCSYYAEYHGLLIGFESRANSYV